MSIRRLTLAVESSNPPYGAGVALGAIEGDDARVLGVERLQEADRHDDDLAPAIDRLVRRAGVAPRDLARIACSVGPGGYTGVRIAVATAAMIAHASGAACVAVPSAAVVARRVRPGGRPFGVALASKGETTWLTLFDERGRPADEGRLVAAAEAATLDVALLVADRHLPAAIRSAAQARRIEIVEPVFDPAACFEASLALPDIDPAALRPIYPREPDAVTRWRSRDTGW